MLQSIFCLENLKQKVYRRRTLKYFINLNNNKTPEESTNTEAPLFTFLEPKNRYDKEKEKEKEKEKRAYF